MKVGVIGTGKMGENHLKNYLEISDRCEVVGIYDVNEHRASEIASKYGVKYFKDLLELLRNVDAVSIAVPTKYHYEVALVCIDHGVHILLEKPMASQLEEAKNLLRRAETAGIKVQVGHIELYNPLIHLLKERLKDEKIIAIDIHRMQPFDLRMQHVDVVFDLMIHDIYILKELLGSEMIHFNTIGKTSEQMPKHAIVSMLFNNGTVAQLTASYKSQEKIRTIRIFTEKAIFKVDLLRNKIEVNQTTYFSIQNDNVKIPQKLLETIEIPHFNPLKSQLYDFIHSVEMDRTPFVTGEDGMNVLKICSNISDNIKLLSSNYDELTSDEL
ncbi:oxidoreductase [Robertmurraya siralis]|uniref:Oxidoreductase n=1 Tax=Robertmurraya siralis TaxID=77777 RepID=A0A920BTE2_9BACI|nr:Gfo/Idh/MocA family oxidoreductase [Robertmurraya siralis]GIN61744.1 oxidoreductase [Robertmurraya siralis]